MLKSCEGQTAVVSLQFLGHDLNVPQAPMQQLWAQLEITRYDERYRNYDDYKNGLKVKIMVYHCQETLFSWFGFPHT